MAKLTSLLAKKNDLNQKAGMGSEDESDMAKGAARVASTNNKMMPASPIQADAASQSNKSLNEQARKVEGLAKDNFQAGSVESAPAGVNTAPVRTAAPPPPATPVVAGPEAPAGVNTTPLRTVPSGVNTAPITPMPLADESTPMVPNNVNNAPLDQSRIAINEAQADSKRAEAMAASPKDYGTHTQTINKSQSEMEATLANPLVLDGKEITKADYIANVVNNLQSPTPEMRRNAANNASKEYDQRNMAQKGVTNIDSLSNRSTDRILFNKEAATKTIQVPNAAPKDDQGGNRIYSWDAKPTQGYVPPPKQEDQQRLVEDATIGVKKAAPLIDAKTLKGIVGVITGIADAYAKGKSYYAGNYDYKTLNELDLAKNREVEGNIAETIGKNDAEIAKQKELMPIENEYKIKLAEGEQAAAEKRELAVAKENIQGRINEIKESGAQDRRTKNELAWLELRLATIQSGNGIGNLVEIEKQQNAAMAKGEGSPPPRTSNSGGGVMSQSAANLANEFTGTETAGIK